MFGAGYSPIGGMWATGQANNLIAAVPQDYIQGSGDQHYDTLLNLAQANINQAQGDDASWMEDTSLLGGFAPLGDAYLRHLEEQKKKQQQQQQPQQPQQQQQNPYNNYYNNTYNTFNQPQQQGAQGPSPLSYRPWGHGSIGTHGLSQNLFQRPYSFGRQVPSQGPLGMMQAGGR